MRLGLVVSLMLLNVIIAVIIIIKYRQTKRELQEIEESIDNDK